MAQNQGSDPRDRIGFTSELGCSVEPHGDTLVGRGKIVTELCLPGRDLVRPSVLLTWADIVTGSLANQHTQPQVCMTADLSVRMTSTVSLGSELIATGRLLKIGRTLIFTEAIFTIAGSEEVVAESLGTFIASPRPQDLGIARVDDLAKAGPWMTGPSAPVSELLQSYTVAPGIVEAPRTQRILNWAETVQGGAISAIAEDALLSLVDAPTPNELEVRYLSAIRVGPIRATARRMGSWVRIEVTDVGNNNRVAAIAMAGGK